MIINILKKIPFLFSVFIILILFEYNLNNVFYEIPSHVCSSKIGYKFYDSYSAGLSEFFVFGVIYLYFIFKMDMKKKLSNETLLYTSLGLIFARLFTLITVYKLKMHFSMKEWALIEELMHFNYYIKYDSYSYFDCSILARILNLIVFFHSISHIYAFLGILLLVYSFVKYDIIFFKDKNRKFKSIYIIFRLVKYLSIPFLFYFLDPLNIYIKYFIFNASF